jgi:CRISPR-associated protein Cas5t
MEAWQTMMWLSIEAPFAACRPMMAGWYRPTAGFVTHSAVYGLILNIAGVESRLGEHEPGHPGGVPATVTRAGLPKFRLALGLPDGDDLPLIGSVFQQLHNYSVGAGNAGIKPEFALGRKNNIAPVRRELLCRLRALAAVQGDNDFLELIRTGLRGEHNETRYGLPFLGDNNYTLDRLEEVAPSSARWLTLADAGRGDPPRAGTSRLTTYIDRVATVGTRSALFCPIDGSSIEPPDSALVPVGDRQEFDNWATRHLPA